MRTLSIDLETYSDVDLTKCGVYAYTASPSFEILLFTYAYEEEEVLLVDLASGESIPEDVLRDLENNDVTKTAYNAQFERTSLSRYLNRPLSPVSWLCTAVQSAMLGLPLSLEGVGLVLGLEQQKLKEGKDLIRYFSIPCKPTQANGNRTRNLPYHAPEKWELFKAYCKRDVDVERAIRNKIKSFPVSEKEQKLYCLDQAINDRGVLVDMVLVRKAIDCDHLYKNDIFTEAQELTGIENPNSVAQLKEWLLNNGVHVESLSKKAVADLARESDGEVERLLSLRLQMAKTSIKKYEAIDRALCPDGRVRGMLQFYGANRTGRWAGRIINVQNLPQNHLKDLTLARNLVKARQFDNLELLFESVPGVLSELIRTAFVPRQGHRFIVADFSAIEARVIAWLAGEKWRMEVFKTHGKIYEASASQMFKVPIEEITKGSPLRQKGKLSELALGFGGGVGALTAMGALDMGVKEEELQPLVTAWRAANPSITKLWWDIDRAALKAVKEKTPQTVGKINLECTSGILFITLPSGRRLSYIKPRIELSKFGREGITFEGIGESKRWSRIDTYGPKLVENAVQGTARDLLAEAMLAVEEAGYLIVMHCHDEVVIETPIGTGSVEEVCTLMSVPPRWAEGLPLRADGYECDYYKKE
ncbi:DNA polymerase [Desulfosporosinus sp.]|uniref:DNA polymerase n=1 Tax=Desulfosporosinus sp. TaxID=157907 RepID=UPI0025B983A7|nr:DNA polymerase [Desulfosporosinus sp.]MBC2723233.1 DNA polymerase [Desulfosporosinus sp.]MBC2727108.1 DNA polymerase [Desulfosporosinus sp.]